MLGLASCQKDFDAANVGAGGEVDFQLSVAAPELATRAGVDGVTPDGQADLNSAYGAIDYLQAEDNGDATLRVDWNDVNLRYTLEVYDKAASYADDVEPVKDRQVKIVDEYAPVVFDLRLVPGREYHFVVFADFVDQAVTDASQTASIADQRTLGKHHEIGNTLADIKVVSDGINDECTDAYFATKDIVIENSAAQDIVLKRPYGKLRVIATDLAELNINVDPTCVVVTYDETHPTEFNAITGETKAVTSTATVTFDSEYNDGVGKASLANHFYTADFDAKKAPNAENVERHTHMTLFTDYILAEKEGQTPYHFTMKVYEDDSKADDKLIKETKFSTDIPVERNKLTTVIGNVLTTATEIEVRIDDNFANGSTWNPEEDDFDMLYVKEPKQDANGNYLISEESELAWLAAAVNGTLSRASEPQTFLGKTFKLTQNINLNNELWTPIGRSSKHTETFRGTFDGQGHTIYNLRVDTEEGAGLFGMVSPKAIKNVTIENAVIKGNHFAGVLAGWIQSVDSQAQNRVVIENCHVKNATVTVAVKDQDNGDKAGALLGYAVRVDVKECSVNRAEVVAYRDVAALIGCAHEGCVVSGNSVNNVYVTADQSAEYVSVEAVNAGDIVGRTIKDPVVENNNTENVEAFYIGAAEHAVVEALEKNFDAVTIMMKSDAVVEIGAWTAPYYLGGIDTKAITIVGNDHILDFKHTNSDWNYIRCSNENAELTITDVKLTNSGYNNGPWNRHNIRFYNDVTLERVVSDKAIALLANGDLKEVTISDVHPNNSEVYGLWISPSPNGQTVNIENCQILAHESKTTDRGIKIDDQYVSAPGKVTLNIDGLKVKSQKKAAILVKSAAGADISISNIDITEVADDTVNAVWVDEDGAAYASLVKVTGANKVIEGNEPLAGETNEEKQAALEDALAANDKVIVLPEGEYTFPAGQIKAGTTIVCEEGTVFTGNSKANINGATIVGATFSNPDGSAVDQTINGTFRDCTFTGVNGLRWCYAGNTCVFENCVFEGSLYGAHFDGGANPITFKNCVFSGFNAFAGATPLVTFEGCTFKSNPNNATYNGANLWGSAKMVNCEFTFDGSTTYEWIDCIGTSKEYSFENCTINGVAYTPENYSDYLIYIESRNSITAKINGIDCAM